MSRRTRQSVSTRPCPKASAISPTPAIVLSTSLRRESRDAENERTTRISRSLGRVTSRGFGKMAPCLSLVISSVVIASPVALGVRPAGHRGAGSSVPKSLDDGRSSRPLLAGLGLDSPRPPLGIDVDRDEARAFEDLEVLRDGRLAHVEGFPELLYGGFAAGEARDDGPPRGSRYPADSQTAGSAHRFTTG